MKEGYAKPLGEVLEREGGEASFGEPALDLKDLMQVDKAGQGMVSIAGLVPAIRGPPGHGPGGEGRAMLGSWSRHSPSQEFKRSDLLSGALTAWIRGTVPKKGRRSACGAPRSR